MSKSIFKHLLNQYFEGKDNNIPAVIESIFSEQAIVTFDIDTDVIEFPAKIVGAKAIAEEMFASFHDDFEKVRSYYVIEPDAASGLLLEQNPIRGIKWLVLMREQSSKLIRVGSGYYNWSFGQSEKTWKIDALHVHIHAMKVFEEPHKAWLDDAQNQFSESWLNYDQAIDYLSQVKDLDGICDYLSLYQEGQVA
jgi:hypothetical protein